MGYREVVLADSPTAYWRLGESSGTAAADETGNGNGATYTNAPTLGAPGVTSDNNKAVTFVSASSQYAVSTTNIDNFFNAVTSSSIEFWIKTTSTATGCVFGTLATGTNLLVQVWINTQDTGSTVAGSTFVGYRAAGGGGNAMRCYITTNIYDGNWHHIVITTPTSSSVAWYVDGVSVSPTYGIQQVITAGTTDFPPTIGARNNRGVIDNHINATLDEVAIYPTVLSASTALAHYNAAFAGGDEGVFDTMRRRRMAGF